MRHSYTGLWSDALVQALPDWAGALETARHVNVLVAASMTQHWVSQAPIGARSLGEIQAYAAARRGQLFGDSISQDWVVQANWQVQRPFMCVALPRPLVDMLAAWRGKAGRHWGLRTELTELMQLTAPMLHGPAWCSAGTPSVAASWLLGEADSVTSLRTWSAPEASTDDDRRIDAVRTELLRAALRDGMDEPSQWFDLVWDGRGYALSKREVRGEIRSVLKRFEVEGLDVTESIQGLAALACLSEVRV